MTPEEILSPLSKRIQLPASVLELLRHLLLHEIKHNKEFDKVLYAELLTRLVLRLPKVRDLDDSSLFAPIKELAGLTRYDFILTFPNRLWDALPNFNVSFDIPQKIRFEHTHVLAGTGAGKTQLLQQLILGDIQTNAAVIVMTLKGSLIPNIAQLECIDPKRLIYFGPDNPIPLNLFSLGGESDSSIELINQIFSGILKADATGKQTALLNNSIRLLLKVKGASLLDLRTLMKSAILPEKYAPAVKELSMVGQEFFNEQFASKTYSDTKNEIMWRLDLLMENTIVQKIFCQPETQLNIHDVMASGKVLLIDTSVRKLGEHGSSFLGRFFIALVTIAAQQRKDTTRPVYFYVDEASSYLTPNIETILERTREARVGLTIAHQQLAQLTPNLEASLITNTSIKFVGRCNDTDARKLASSLRVEYEQLQHQEPLHFHMKAQGFVRHAIKIKIKAGYMESLAKRKATHSEHAAANDNAIDLKAAQDKAKYTPDTKTKPSSDW